MPNEVTPIRRQTPRTPAAKAQKPKPPADAVLTGRALEIAAELRPALELSGRLRPEYAPVFRVLCHTAAIAEVAGASLQGVETEGRSDKRTSDPAWRGFRDAATLLVQVAREFGLTPASAAQVKVAAAPDEDAERLLA